MQIKKVRSDESIIRPYSQYYTDKIMTDLCMVDEKGEFLYICGENDWGFLALELLEPIKKEADKLLSKVRDVLTRKAIKAIMVGKNEKRILDINAGGKDKCTKIFGIPIILCDEINCFEFLVEYDSHEDKEKEN